MEKFGLNVSVMGVDQQDYMAKLLEINEKQEIEIERGKLSVSILKQMNNRSRLLLDAAKFELKSKEFFSKASEAISRNHSQDNDRPSL